MADLRFAEPRLVGHLIVYPALVHEGEARSLVHKLKYHGMAAPAGPLAVAMVRRLPRETRALIPVPRTWARRARYGIDPAWELARAMARITGIPAVSCLVAPLWAPALAGRSRGRRAHPQFKMRQPAPPSSVLVDDVITTGVTLKVAAELLAVRWAVTATGAGI